MLSFESDYVEGCHEQILKRLIETNLEKLPGYGTDCYTERAKEKIKAVCACDTAEVHLLTGGTQTNQIVIDTMLAPYEGVVAAETGHISLHEAGAIEYTGHKVMTLPQTLGKLSATELEQFLKQFWSDANHEHMVFPGMVYISHPTEYGTLYTKEELGRISAVCREYQIPLFLDGARLGYGLASRETDVTLPDIAKYTDVFYIGGTKVGALFGEAVVITNSALCNRCFVTMIKRHGALLAKGRILGIQFDTLFTDDLYLKISKNAIDMAMYLKEELTARGYRFHIDSSTNQQFVVLANDKIEKLRKDVGFTYWEKINENESVIRFVTSFATTKEQVDELLSYM